MKKIFIFLTFSSLFANAQSYVVSTAAGNGIAGNVNGSASVCEFNRPYGVKSDNDSVLYIADVVNNSIRKLNLNANIVSLVAGTGTAGHADGIGTSAKFNSPVGLFYLSGYLYVAEATNYIRKIDLNNNNNVTTIAGNGVAGFQNGAALSAKFNNPTALHVESNGDIYVSDYQNHCIRLISSGQVSTFAGVPTTGGLINGGSASAEFNKPRDIIKDSNGDFYVADLVNNVIRKISGGIVSTFSGSGVQGSTNGNASTASFYHPGGICVTSNGYFYIADVGNNLVRKIDPSGTVSTVAGTGSAGYLDGAGAIAQFNDLEGICYDNKGNIYLGDDLNNRVRKLSVPEVFSIDELETVNELKIFPNPSYGIFTFSFKGNSSEKITFLISSVIGKQLKSGQVVKGVNKMDVSDLDNGVYLFIINACGKQINKKIVIQK